MSIRFSIGGTIFTTTLDTISRFPGTRLANLTTQSPSYIPSTKLHFFDRDPVAFACILNYYRTGELHLPTNLCGNAIRKEIEFWDVNERQVSECCLPHFLATDMGRVVIETLNQKMTAFDILGDVGGSSWALLKQKIWIIVDKPNSCRAAKIWNTIFMTFILTSAVILCVDTLTGARVPRYQNPNRHMSTQMRKRMDKEGSNVKIKLVVYTEPHPVLTNLEAICLAVFTIELLVHFATSPDMCMLLRKFLIWIDIITIIMGWATFIIESFVDVGVVPVTIHLYYTYLIMKCLSILRLLRFFRLVDRFSSLKVMMLALRASMAELALLMFCIFVLATIFGSFAYLCEFENNNFLSIPISIWWALVTMTTVGYGDYYPSTYCGRGVGTMCALCGLLILAMPITVIATNFNEYHSRNMCREKRMRNDLFNKKFQLAKNLIK